MKPLWKIRSGEFAGWKINDALYNSDGENIGYFIDDLAYSLSGQCIAEIYLSDWIGTRNVIYPIGSPRAGFAGIAAPAYSGRVGLSIGGWQDPDFSLL